MSHKKMKNKMQLEEKITELEKKIQDMEDMRLRQTLIAKLLSASPKNQGVNNYFHVLNHDFLAFSNKVPYLDDEMIAFLELQKIGDELTMIGSYPCFFKKRSVAIGGGFSAGKSALINSLFLRQDVHLPTAMTPTTAIPTYVLNGEKNEIIACNQKGGVIDLAEIAPNFQHKLSHNFIRDFGFNLKTIMPFVFLTTPMAFEHLCFIDTPGYNPSNAVDGYTSEDNETAKEFVSNADALLWVISVAHNGTVPQSDLDFLADVTQDSNRPLYIVLSQADLRPLEHVKDIMDTVEEILDDEDIEIIGISAYSATRKTEYGYRKQSLFDFLKELDAPSGKQDVILKRLYAVDEKYQRAILRGIKENNEIKAILYDLQLALLKNGFDELGGEIHQKIHKINALFSHNQQEENLKWLMQVIQKLSNSINQVFGQESHIERKTLTIQDIELNNNVQDDTSAIISENEKAAIKVEYWSGLDKFLADYWDVSFSMEQLKAIKLLIDKKQFSFTLADWQSIYEGNTAMFELGRLVKAGVLTKNSTYKGSYYSFNSRIDVH
ncbi:dynamin family protein [Providencia stuartii]|uniref:dynamin family protein n=1 Tax=Providencia stuartii TaxID=588 RepID=UPI0018C4A3E5|nr:dynamin family protein [Providencia stuartii]MBG5898628.1 dynamin family protein [Providencia stuartii]MCX3072178.1 dynamin family protein [Providencia stuartii]